jgi:hypothetical protein
MNSFIVGVIYRVVGAGGSKIFRDLLRVFNNNI